jgi:hypothetical protein
MFQIGAASRELNIHTSNQAVAIHEVESTLSLSKGALLQTRHPSTGSG